MLCFKRDADDAERRLSSTHFEVVTNITDQNMTRWHTTFCLSVALGLISFCLMFAIVGAYCIPWTEQYVTFTRDYAETNCKVVAIETLKLPAFCSCYKCTSDPTCHCHAKFSCFTANVTYDVTGQDGNTETRLGNLYQTIDDNQCYYSFIHGCDTDEPANNKTAMLEISKLQLQQTMPCWYHTSEPQRVLQTPATSLSSVVHCYFWDGALTLFLWLIVVMSAYKSGCYEISQAHLRNSEYYFYHAPHQKNHKQNIIKTQSAMASVSKSGKKKKPSISALNHFYTSSQSSVCMGVNPGFESESGSDDTSKPDETNTKL